MMVLLGKKRCDEKVGIFFIELNLIGLKINVVYSAVIVSFVYVLVARLGIIWFSGWNRESCDTDSKKVKLITRRW